MLLIRLLLACFVGLAVIAAPALAEVTEQAAPAIDKRKLLVQPRNADGTLKTVAFSDDPVLWIRDQQQRFYGSMSGALRQIKTGAPLAATWTLMLLSFGFGVFLAAGPGLGMAVISAWLLATDNDLRRGVLIALLSALIQALTAIAIVSALLLLVAGAGAVARDVAGYLESASYALIGSMGLYLIWTAFRPHAHEAAHDQHHHHHHDEHCGHAHVPEARQVKGEWSLAKAFSLSFTVGIRPCTGAILVLIFANAQGHDSAGIASPVAMAAGTFLTVPAIAAVAVYSRQLAMRLARRGDRWPGLLASGLRIGGGVAIALLGGMLFVGSLGTSNGMM